MKRLLIWGTGKVSVEFTRRAILKPDFELIGYVESEPLCSHYEKKKLYSASNLKDLEYDYLVIASSFTDEILRFLINEQLRLDNLLLLRRTKFSDMLSITSHNIGHIVENIVDFWMDIDDERKSVNVLRNGLEYRENSILHDRKFISNTINPPDYVRYRTLEMVSKFLIEENISGSVAEVGVFRGEFARFLNKLFPNKKLYLFDTFEGFDKKEAERDIQIGNVNRNFIEIFNTTSVDLVLSKMVNKENCIIKKGLFPDSAIGIDDSFSLVSIDVDFEESIYQSLIYFYPRLNKGGYIFLHDYNHLCLKGVKNGFDRFEFEMGRVCKTAIPDEAGTLIIQKPFT